MPLRYAEPGHVGLGRALEQDCIDSALELVTLPQHGITLRLIGAMIATTAACCHATPGYKATARQFLAEVGPQLPAAQSILATLEDILQQPAPEKINQALTALPFNYR